MNSLKGKKSVPVEYCTFFFFGSCLFCIPSVYIKRPCNSMLKCLAKASSRFALMKTDFCGTTLSNITDTSLQD